MPEPVDRQEQPKNMSVEQPKPSGPEGGQKTAGKIKSWINENRDKPAKIWDKFKGEEIGIEKGEKAMNEISRFLNDSIAASKVDAPFLFAAAGGALALGQPEGAIILGTLGLMDLLPIPLKTGGVPVAAERIIRFGARKIKEIRNRNNPPENGAPTTPTEKSA